MAKIVFMLFNLFILSSFAFEDMPIIPQNSGINIEYIENNQSLINFDKMKKSSIIKEAQNKTNENSKTKFQFDTRQINHQRALDFTTNQNNYTLLPRF